MKRIACFLILIIAVGVLGGCGTLSDTLEKVSTSQELVEIESASEGEVTSVSVTLDMISEAELVDENESETIDLDDAEEIVLNKDSITISSAGTYHISGSLSNGQIIVDAGDEDDVQVVLEDVSISCAYSAPIYVVNADKVTVSVIGDNNSLAITGDISASEESVDGVIYSKDDLVLNGSGSLYISSEYSHGIVGNDDLEILSGTYEITVLGDGIQVNDSITVIDAYISIVADKDGMQVSNEEDEEKGYVYLENSELIIHSGEDAINASNYIYAVSGSYLIDATTDGLSADSYVYISGGTFEIKTGGGFDEVLNIITVGEGSSGTVSETDKLEDSMKAIKSDDIVIEGGNFVIDSYEDGFNANNNIVVNGGDINVNSGDEAFTAKNTLEINDGTIIIENGYEGLEGAYITINGGNISINVLDDGINGGESYSVVTITGGTLYVSCQGDGLDSNGDMVISGGDITLDVSAIYVGGDGNVDVTGTLTYTGGTIVDASGATIDPTESMESMGEMMPGAMPGGETGVAPSTGRRR